jgi:glycosyltransferase involved in cell wall biosynthesis
MHRIIYISPADEKPTGGVKVIYRHAELLASLGADAYVLHPFDPGFKCTWFSHHTRMLTSLALDSENDFVIIPELWAASFGPQCIAQRVRFAIFVQNGYLTHPVLPSQPAEVFGQVYRSADLVLSISEDSSRMTALSYPSLDPSRLVEVRYSVPECFRADPGATKLPCITYMPRKMAHHAKLVTFPLRRRLPARWQIVPIDGVDEATVATMLAASSIFLSFSEFEGLPLPPLEAAIAGNVVIGYTGQGAREYWTGANFREIHQGDIRSFVNAAVQTATDIDSQKQSRAALAQGIERLTERFSLASETANLRSLLDRIESCFIRPPNGAVLAAAA